MTPTHYSRQVSFAFVLIGCVLGWLIAQSIRHKQQIEPMQELLLSLANEQEVHRDTLFNHGDAITGLRWRLDGTNGVEHLEDVQINNFTTNNSLTIGPPPLVLSGTGDSPSIYVRLGDGTGEQAEQAIVWTRWRPTIDGTNHSWVILFKEEE